MADLMAGETRAFFAANPDLMEFAASRTLITRASYEPVVTVGRAEGKLYKTGALNRLPAGVRKKWLVQDPAGRTVLPLFRELLGAGVATCYSSWGQPRHIAIFDGYRMAPLLQHFGDKPLREIRTADIEDFVASLKIPALLASHQKTARVRRPATINRYLSLLKHMFNWAVGREYLERTPFRRGTRT